MRSPEELNQALQNAQKASVSIRSLLHAWVELPGIEVELMLEMASQYADQVTEYLINQSGEDSGESPE